MFWTVAGRSGPPRRIGNCLGTLGTCLAHRSDIISNIPGPLRTQEAWSISSGRSGINTQVSAQSPHLEFKPGIENPFPSMLLFPHIPLPCRACFGTVRLENSSCHYSQCHLLNICIAVPSIVAPLGPPTMDQDGEIPQAPGAGTWAFFKNSDT